MPALDGIRGLAVLLVLLDHASDQDMRVMPGADLNRLGKYGVYLFFVLSAFLLTSQLYVRSREELLEGRTWLNYATRRFLRIFPVYTVVIAAMIVMEKLKPSDFWTHLLLRDGRRIYWTIPVEVKFYIILPLLAVAFAWANGKHWLWRLGAGLLTALACGGLLWFEQIWSIHENVLLLPNLPPFLIGMAAGIAYGRIQRSGRASQYARWFQVAAIAAMIGVFLRLPVFFNLLRPEDPISKWAYDEMICGAFWSIFTLGIVVGGGWLESFLRWAPLRYLGLISFSAYLWHWKFVSDVDDLPVPPVLRLVVFLAIVIAVASVSYFLLERPLQKIRPRRAAGLAAAGAP